MKRRLSLALLALAGILSLAARPALAADKYYVPPNQFNAAFQVMDQGFANVFGMFQSATGAFQFDPSSQTLSHVKLAIDAESLVTPNRDAARDLFTLLDPDTYPEMTFMATAPATFKDGKAEIKGTLSVHGQSKPATFEGTLNHVGTSPHGGGFFGGEGAAIGLSLRGSFKRADFAMGDPPEIPGRFGESLTLLLEMQGLKQ